MKRGLLALIACPQCHGELGLECCDEWAEDGTLRCRRCSTLYDIVGGIPHLLVGQTASESKTSRLYGDIWRRYRQSDDTSGGAYRAPARSHTELLRLASGTELAVGDTGVDAGCGDGSEVISMAKSHPNKTIVGFDLSDGMTLHSAEARRLGNAHFVRGNLLAPPLALSSFDFIYSFGVLHHTRDPLMAFRMLLNCLRPSGRITIFVYKDFSDIPVKRLLLIPVTLLRLLTTKLPPAVLRRLAWLGAPAVFASMTLPARLLRRLGVSRLARHIPYGTFPTIKSVASSLQDRFGAPYEHRFSLEDLRRWADQCHLENAHAVDCLPFGFSGLVLTGTKTDTEIETDR